jgi:hypothetical protein
MKRPTWMLWAGGTWLGIAVAVLVPLEIIHIIAPDQAPRAIMRLAPWFVGFAYAFLAAVVLAERPVPEGDPTPLRRYVAYGLIASALCVAVIGFFPHLITRDGRRDVVDTYDKSKRYIGQDNSISANATLSVEVMLHAWLLLLAYAHLRNGRLAMLKIARAEVGRAEAARLLSAAQLEAAAAELDPDFLSRSLEEIERTYDMDPPRADAMLGQLMMVLRQAIPKVRAA